MHEYGITQQILVAAVEAAEREGAVGISEIRVSVGEMTEVVESALRFNFEVLKEGTMAEEADLVVTMIRPRSRCQTCGAEYEHDKLDLTCPECHGFLCDLVAGRELRIDSIEADVPDE